MRENAGHLDSGVRNIEHIKQNDLCNSQVEPFVVVKVLYLAMKKRIRKQTTIRKRNAEIYPGIATEPVGGTGSKATGLEASRS